ncbi:MAG: phenylalanine--tRNA ligase subunit beta [Nitrososphaeraceae archaeon]|nr:phenylalanine--tRNA ligase subunit beta [Nitrososphaeraceae archaeon]MDW0190842.1 phenylalanine--tRNA ligase subunit beta [Nitrososphaeraceae archaeon]MDW0208928.1 phenylalanine--tRNA ligase subunit beta [Nitrososphaeraceae archaeon]MDW0237722.1 phenylalanine--tRNA ligase subunit beta [Nitrososphaeraceae archaeon]MDW0261030.1 phenylalanine--tRNA ligase subunit beta [Nitrososphaeraceae archaeon]
MPVVEFPLEDIIRLFPDYDLEYTIDMLPFLGLDIEYRDDKCIRLEYSPNRPDFSTYYGISRALNGLLGKEVGIPKFKLIENRKNLINVDSSVSNIRPYIASIVARGHKLNDKTIKQIVSMQEDLHNGIGRKRSRASIGLHNLDTIEFPLDYTTRPGNLSFTPLDYSSSLTLSEVLEKTESGKKFRELLLGSIYPVLMDSRRNLLSFPPVINAEYTRIKGGVKNLLLEVTGVDKTTVDKVLANIAATLADIGFSLETVSINQDSNTTTSFNSMENTRLDNIKTDYINKKLGLSLSNEDVILCLRKSRLDAKVTDGSNINCMIPSYRIDIFNSMDIVEEVAIGYGIYNMEPTLPEFTLYGNKSRQNHYFDKIRQALVGMGLIENINFILSNKDIHLRRMKIEKSDFFTVNNSKSEEHDILRKSLLPSLLFSLSKNIHEEYPQKLFEIGQVFLPEQENSEKWNLCCATAFNGVTFTKIKAILQTLMEICLGTTFETKAAEHSSFISGRSADIFYKGKTVGQIGEVSPLLIDSFKIKMPVAAFDLDLTELLQI